MRILFLLLLISLLAACNNVNTTVEKDKSSNSTEIVKGHILDVLNNQQASWNKGDIDGFMEGYWKSDSLSFIGSRGVTNGWEQTLENYKKAYPDLKTMGRLQFEMIALNKISGSAYQMIGKYTLYRDEDEPSGYFTLLWRKIDEHWLIVSDQTCG